MARDIWIKDKANPSQWFWLWGVGALVALGLLVLVAYPMFVIEVPPKHVAVLTRLTGKDLPNGEEVAPDATYKGIQKEMLAAGRHFYNPYEWDWDVIPQQEIPDGKVGIAVRLFGDDLGYGEFLALKPNQKGIVPGYLRPGLHSINPHTTTLILRETTVVPAGFQGVVTNLSGPLATKDEDFDVDPEDKYSKRMLVKKGFRGVSRETLNEGAYAFNPYEQRIDLIDCRSQRFDLGEEGEIGFPSKDGFWVSLDGIVEFRINPKKAAVVYVIYNEFTNGPRIDEEIVKKIILPTARSFCRLQGSNNLGRDFIQGTTRGEFQKKFEEALREECEPLGIDVIQGLITRITPPQQIAKPVRDRELARQNELQYQQEIKQQTAEQKLAIEKELVNQKQALVKIEQENLKVTTEAERDQEVAVTKAKERQAVAALTLEAAKDEAAAIATRGKAAAEVIRLTNAAEAAGWKQAVEAFGGSGGLYAQYVLYQKMSGAYRSMMINTADSPIMKVFEAFNKPAGPMPSASGSTTTASDVRGDTP